MIGSLLGDPESLKQLEELAELLKSETQPAQTAGAPSPDSTTDPQGNAAQNSSGDLGIDPVSLMKILSAVSSAGESDKNRALLLALKPYLGKTRRDKVDKAVKLLKLYAIVTELKKSGMIDNLDRLL